jgi:XkdW protein
MNIAHVLMYMFPGTDTPDDWKVSMVDGVQFISGWYLSEPQPTMEEIEVAYEELKKIPPEPEPPTLDERVSILEHEVEELKNA